MKRLYYLGIFALLLVLAIPHTAQAAGRLNFMLTNLTGQTITGVKIAPTSYPGHQSENLLNRGLDPRNRLYIGPNYYGEQRNWNITITWNNGYSHTWRHCQLTRYNSYVVYAGNYGVNMRQGFERAYARYGSGPTPTMFAGSQPGVSVAVGVPEQVNVVAMNTTRNVGNSTRKTRDLVFDDEEETAARPAVEGTAAAEVKGETIAVKATVELTRDGSVSTVLPTEDFKSGDKVRLLFSSNKDGHVYWVAKGTSGKYQVLFPSAKAGMDNKIVKNKEYTVPTKGAWRFDDKKGTETLVCILSPKPVAELDKAVALAGEGKTDDASSTIEPVVTGHETKRTTRDLVFEEEDENDVNTKTQVTPGDEPFVATYELTHN